MLNIEELKNILEKTSVDKVVIIIRHAEKADRNTDSLLTEEGITKTEEFAKKIKNLDLNMKIYSSPELRCIKTAKIINQIFSNNENDIVLTKKLGDPGIQIKNKNKYLKLYSANRCRDIYLEWKKGKYRDILYPPDILKEKSEIFLKKTCEDNGITLYISQSGTVAHLGYVFNKKEYSVEFGEWVDFLDGFFILNPKY